MKRYILTGAPGAGKTVILRVLERRGYCVVGEAATDVVARGRAHGNATPWTAPRFIDDMVRLQRSRQERADTLDAQATVLDRSPICTLALARFLGFPVSEPLAQELERLRRLGLYERRVAFVESLGFITHTAARRISLEEATAFGALHEAVYRELGYDLIRIAPGPPETRADEVQVLMGAPAANGFAAARRPWR